jgi:hypothetical protein
MGSRSSSDADGAPAGRDQMGAKGGQARQGQAAAGRLVRGLLWPHVAFSAGFS